MDDLRQEVIDYILSDTVAKERFSDIEICTEDDNYIANEEVFDIVSRYTDEDCINFLNAMEDGADIVAGGWIDSNGEYQPKSTYASTSIKCGTKYPSNYVKASKDKKPMTNQEAIGILLYIRTLLDNQEDIDEINEALKLAVKALRDSN